MRHNFQCFKYFLFRYCLYFKYFQNAPHPLITLRRWQLPSVYTIKMANHSLRNDTLYNVLTLEMTTFSQEMSRHFDSVNTGELPASESNQWMTGILKIYEM